MPYPFLFLQQAKFSHKNLRKSPPLFNLFLRSQKTLCTSVVRMNSKGTGMPGVPPKSLLDDYTPFSLRNAHYPKYTFIYHFQYSPEPIEA
jgi:hypothetical protein